MNNATTPLVDGQLVETVALKEYADILIQVSAIPSSSMESKTGFFFRISVQEVATGRIIANIFHDGVLPKQSPKKVWEAVRGGYVEKEEEETEVSEFDDLKFIGRILSEKTMAALASI